MTKKVLFNNEVEGFEIWHGNTPFGYYPQWDEWWSSSWSDNLEEEKACLIRKGKEFFLHTETYNGKHYTTKIQTPFRIRI